MNESNEPNPTNVPAPSEYGAFVGVDWGDEEHAVSLRAASGTVIERLTLQQTPEALAQWLNTLRTRFPNQKIAIALEQSRGPLLAGLTQYEHIVPFPVNPKSLARFREALYPSRSKDDLGDADLLLEFLLKHRSHLRPWRPDTVQTRQLTLLNEQRRNFVDSRTELTNRLLAHLKMIFPQAIDLVGRDSASPMAADFLKKWPSLQAVQKVSPSDLRKFYYGHNSKSKWVHIRWSCPKFLRQSWHEFANCSIRFCPWARDCYNEYRKRNIAHQEAIRKLAFKWQRIVWRMWQDRQPYDEARYEAALLKKRGQKTSATTSQPDSLSGEQKNKNS